MTPKLTPEQFMTLQAYIAANSDLSSQPMTPDGNFEIARLMNLPAAAPNTVWRTSVEITEVMQNGFDWARVDNLLAGKARIWEWMTRAGQVNPSHGNVRAGVLACFTAPADSANRQAVFNHSVRSATRAEKLFAAGSFTAPTDQGVGPGTMVLEGNLTLQDVETARG